MDLTNNIKTYKDNINIYLMDELNIDFTNIHNIEIFYIITKGNPGALTVLMEIYKQNNDGEILAFLHNIWKHQIIGTRLWYIYKNECNLNIQDLLSKDLTPFTNEYFYEKFEKYI